MPSRALIKVSWLRAQRIRRLRDKWETMKKYTNPPGFLRFVRPYDLNSCGKQLWSSLQAVDPEAQVSSTGRRGPTNLQRRR